MINNDIQQIRLLWQYDEQTICCDLLLQYLSMDSIFQEPLNFASKQAVSNLKYHKQIQLHKKELSVLFACK